MMRNATCSVWICLILSAGKGLAEAGEPAAPTIVRSAGLGPAPPESVTQPLVLRIPRRALEPFATEDISYHDRVQQVTGGTQVVGRSHTRGNVDKHIVTDRDCAALLITFDGRTVSRTVGYNGPAIIHSRTFTEFACTRCVSFDPLVGLSTSPSSILSNTHLTHDGFGSTRRGLAGAVIRKVARRQAHRSHAQSERDTAQGITDEIRQKFNDHLDARVAEFNKRLDPLRTLAKLFGDDAKLTISASSNRDGLQFAVARQGDPVQVRALPPLLRSDFSAEIWIHSTLVGPEDLQAGELIERLEAGTYSAVAKLTALKTILAARKMPESNWETAVCGEWLVVALRGEAQAALVSAVGR